MQNFLHHVDRVFLKHENLDEQFKLESESKSKVGAGVKQINVMALKQAFARKSTFIARYMKKRFKPNQWRRTLEENIEFP